MDESIITKKSLISLEVLILAIGMVVTVVTTSLIQGSAIENNREDIVELQKSFKEMHDMLDIIDEKLDDLMWAMKVESEVAAVRMSDRWSSDCEQDSHNAWLSIIQKYHPEVHKEDLPDIKEIQENNGFR